MSDLCVVFADVTIVITHFQTLAILDECLERVMRFASAATVMVIDSSEDDSFETIKANHPDLALLKVTNHSMANTVNAGLKQAKTKFILQMNADVYLNEQSLTDLLKALDQTKVGMVGPLCYNKNGEAQRQGLLYKRYYWQLNSQAKVSLNVSWLSGCCMLIKKEALEQVGGLNSSLRFYNEDMEWSWRFRKAKWQCHLVNTRVTHLGGSSTPNDAKFIVEGYRGGLLLSLWYKPKIYQLMHFAFVWLEARFKSRSKLPLERLAYIAILEMLSTPVHESPFAETLSNAALWFRSLEKADETQSIRLP